MNSGYTCCMPADETSTCSWDSVNPSSELSIGPSTELIVATHAPVTSAPVWPYRPSESAVRTSAIALRLMRVRSGRPLPAEL